MGTREIRTTLQKAGIYPDILRKKQGTNTIVFKKSYFYSFGKSAEQYAQEIKKVLPVHITRVETSCKIWPKTSYFIVEFTV